MLHLWQETLSNLDKFWLFRVLCVLLDNQDIQEYPLGYQEDNQGLTASDDQHSSELEK